MRKAPTPCIEDGCANNAERGSECRGHFLARRREIDARRPGARARGYDARWERTSKAFIRDNPECELCDEPTTDVHHRDGLGPSGPRGHDHANLQPLCHACHSRVTSEAQPGGWNA